MMCPNCHGQTYDLTTHVVAYHCGGRQPGCEVVITRPAEDAGYPIANCAHCKQPRQVKSRYSHDVHYCAECDAWV